ncbi:hypothetical protein Riv7116_1498 [Rivularia sp. PCC 7116]|uniref:hypothetical protein n=1 Tax=Rivularia sp. PCC 7116 TaxID=373994 RepID=UPI00029F37F3|nr:hypothetical protein [Rivularia sp. PCC 7116]AFY54058.1 hypothetical protein Riv7116_1498 [Rivularia sp. PCC 7116]
MSVTNTLSENKKNQAKTRLLLALFEAQESVMKAKLNDRVVPSKEKAKDYQSVFDELLEIGAIEKSKKGYSLVLPKGRELLDESLKTTDFENNTIGTWVANALLKLIRENQSKTNYSTELQNQAQIKDSPNEEIASYDKFKEITLEVYDKLNRNYNLDNLVPIYRIRKEVGEKVSRDNFNQWMLEMQKKDILQLIGGEMTDITPEKAEDSITTKLSGLRYYAKRIA